MEGETADRGSGGRDCRQGQWRERLLTAGVEGETADRGQLN